MLHHNALPERHKLKRKRYELVRELGSGSFSITYLGFDDEKNEGVAIKEYLRSDIATRTPNHEVVPHASHYQKDFDWGLARFKEEAKTLERFNHSQIIKVYDYFEAHGTAYIVMEYAEGETLSKYLERQGTLNEAELKGILYPLLDGLAVVHETDILHRDIKPDNIVIRAEDGSPVLLDFGAARQAIGERSGSITSILTPGYAPIEQYSSRGNQGAWTDIYALGGVCYQALTGQVPEDATERVRNDRLIPVAECCTDRASQGFLSAVDTALSVHANDRPQSVAAWREALEAEPEPEPRDEQRRRFHWTQVAIAVLVGVLVLGSLSSWYIFQDRQFSNGIFNELEELERYEKARDAAVDANNPQPLKDFVDRNPNSPYVSRADSLIQAWDERAD